VIEPSTKRATVGGMAVSRVVDGKVVSHWCEIDRAAVIGAEAAGAGGGGAMKTSRTAGSAVSPRRSRSSAWQRRVTVLEPGPAVGSDRSRADGLAQRQACSSGSASGTPRRRAARRSSASSSTWRGGRWALAVGELTRTLGSPTVGINRSDLHGRWPPRSSGHAAPRRGVRGSSRTMTA
jgi:hypothetical protein